MYDAIYLEEDHFKYQSASSYFNALLSLYAQLSPEKREQIIFKDAYDTVRNALSKKKKVSFHIHDKKFEVHPYKLTTGKEELFTYLLGTAHEVPHRNALVSPEERLRVISHSFRLSRMKYVTLLDKDASFTEGDIEKLKLTLEHGPQFIIRQDHEVTQTIQVQLTEAGKELYDRMYVHRPPTSSSDGSIYKFNCSETEVFLYFKRFGKEALILAPEHLKERMETYHKEAFDLYKNL